MYTLDLPDEQTLYFAHIRQTNVTSYQPAVLVAAYLHGQFKGGSVVDHREVVHLISAAFLRRDCQVQSSAAAYLMATDFVHSAAGSLILSDLQGDDHELPLTSDLLTCLAQTQQSNAEPLFAVLMRLPDHGISLHLTSDDSSVAEAAAYLLEHSDLEPVPDPPVRPETDLSRVPQAERASTVNALSEFEAAEHQRNNILQRHHIHASNVQHQFRSLLVFLGPADLPHPVREAVYQEAYIRGHSHGEKEIEQIYHDLCEFARNVLKAARGNTHENP